MDHFASFDGIPIAYLDTGPRDGAPVLLLHGFAADHHANWVAPGVVAALVDAGCRVLAPDARGHGQSGKPHDPDAYAHGAMAHDATALLDHLDLDAVHVAGYSMGAIVAAQLVPNEPRARSLVLGGVGGRLVAGRMAARRTEIVDALLADDPRAISNVMARAFRRFADRTGADRRALAAFQRSTRAADRPEFAAIRVPTLVIAGDRDTLAAEPQALAAAIPGATVQIIAGDHLNAVFDPAFRAAIVEFVSRTLLRDGDPH